MTDTNTIIQIAPNQYQVMLDNYASIVEKTNNQLVSGINLSSLAVAILSIIIAVIAIFVAWALWKNGKDQKDRMEQFFSEQEKIIREKNKNIQKFELKFENLINEYKEKLKGTDGENKKQLEKVINELKKEKASAGAYIGLDSVLSSPIRAGNFMPLSTSVLGYEKTMICSKCSKMFIYCDDNITNNGMYTVLFNPISTEKKTVYCSNCGAVNVSE